MQSIRDNSKPHKSDIRLSRKFNSQNSLLFSTQICLFISKCTPFKSNFLWKFYFHFMHENNNWKNTLIFILHYLSHSPHTIPYSYYSSCSKRKVRFVSLSGGGVFFVPPPLQLNYTQLVSWKSFFHHSASCLVHKGNYIQSFVISRQISLFVYVSSVFKTMKM